jgi:hypothetical protein
MNYQKLQSDILKEVSKYPSKLDIHRKTFIGFAKYNYHIACITDCCVYLIHESNFYLDYEKLVDSTKDYTDSINKLINIDSDFKACIKTLRSIELEKNKSCNIFDVDGIEVFINKKLLVYFNNDDNYYYKGKNEKSPICIYDIQADHLIGYILPVNPKFL